MKGEGWPKSKVAYRRGEPPRSYFEWPQHERPGRGTPALFRSVDPSTRLRANGTPTPRDGLRVGGRDVGSVSIRYARLWPRLHLISGGEIWKLTSCLLRY